MLPINGASRRSGRPGGDGAGGTRTSVNNYGKLPLIAWQPAGKGRVMLVGTDSTWLWRQNVGDRFFYKFWGQAIRFVARTEDAGKKKAGSRSSRSAPAGRGREVELRAYTAGGAPVEQPSLAGRDHRPGDARQAVVLDADPNTKGRYVGKYRVPAVGDFRLPSTPAARPRPACGCWLSPGGDAATRT